MKRIRENDKERYGWDQDTGRLIHIDKTRNDDTRESLDTYEDKEGAEKGLDTTVRWGPWESLTIPALIIYSQGAAAGAPTAGCSGSFKTKQLSVQDRSFWRDNRVDKVGGICRHDALIAERTDHLALYSQDKQSDLCRPQSYCLRVIGDQAIKHGVLKHRFTDQAAFDILNGPREYPGGFLLSASLPSLLCHRRPLRPRTSHLERARARAR